MLALKEYSLLTFENVIQERIRSHLFDQIQNPYVFFQTFSFTEEELKGTEKQKVNFFINQIQKEDEEKNQQIGLIEQPEIKTLGESQNKQFDLAGNFSDAKIFSATSVKIDNFEGFFVLKVLSPIKNEDVVVGQEIIENPDGSVDKFDNTVKVRYRIDEYFLIEKSNLLTKGFNNLGKIGDVLVILEGSSADAIQQVANQNNTSTNFQKKVEFLTTKDAISEYNFDYSNQKESLTLVSAQQLNDNRIANLYATFLKSIEPNKKYYQFAAYYLRRNGSIPGITPITSKPSSKPGYLKEADQGILELFAKEFSEIATIVCEFISNKLSNDIKNVNNVIGVGVTDKLFGGTEKVISTKNAELQKTINNIDRNLITLIDSIEVA